MFNRDSRFGSVKAVGETRWYAGVAPGPDCRQTLRTIVERVDNNHTLFVGDLEQTLVDHLRDSRINSGNRARPLEHVESARLYTVHRDARLGRQWLRIYEETIRDERGVDVAQGVHDALKWYASQRPRAERHVESLAWDPQCLGGVDAEADSAALLSRQRDISRSDVFVTRIEGIDARSARRRELREATIAAADINNPLAAEPHEGIDRGSLDSCLVTAVHAG